MLTYEEEKADFLAHYGVKGMRWGVVKEPKLNPREKKVLNSLNIDLSKGKELEGKYGKDPTKKDNSVRNKRILIGAGISLAVVGVVVTAAIIEKKGRIHAAELNKYGVADMIKNRLGGDKLPTSMKDFMDAKMTKSRAHLTKGLTESEFNALDSVDLSFDKGSIFKRISTVKEMDINDSGFYASFKPDDVDRYKAALPIFWKQWGYKETEGFVVNIQNDAPVKVASSKKAFEVFKNSLNDEVFSGVQLRDTYALPMVLNDDAFAKAAYPTFAASWANPFTLGADGFFNKIKAMGYSGLVDSNDAGSMAELPIRFLDSEKFSIAGHESLTSEAIKIAQETITALKQFFANFVKDVSVIYSKMGGG